MHSCCRGGSVQWGFRAFSLKTGNKVDESGETETTKQSCGPKTQTNNELKDAKPPCVAEGNSRVG